MNEHAGLEPYGPMSGKGSNLLTSWAHASSAKAGRLKSHGIIAGALPKQKANG